MFTQQFTPEPDHTLKVPFFDDVTGADGWEGHESGKSIDTLKNEITVNMARLGCIVTGFVAGSYDNRLGYQIHFAVRLPEGVLAPSRLDIACLPLKPRVKQHGPDARPDKTRRMGLYMVNKALKGLFFFSVLAPGFVPFMSLMLDNKQRTLGSVWISSGKLTELMPPTKGDFEEDIVDAEEG
jgi:hypothetical protein